MEKTALERYWLAIINEYRLDQMINRSYKIELDEFVVPRYNKFKKYRLNIRFLVVLLSLASFFWMPIFRMLQYRLYWRTQRAFRRVHPHKDISSRIVLLTNHLAGGLYANTGETYSASYLHVPWIKHKVTPDDLDLLSCVTISEIRSAYLLTKEWSKTYRKRSKGWHHTLKLQTYDAFYWFFLDVALEKLSPDELYFANHYDRWAVLVDLNAMTSKKIQLQHGLISPQSVGQYKLANIDTCYCYNNYFADVFRQYVYEDTSQTRFIMYANKLSLQETGTKYSALFIGSPFDTQRELDIISFCCSIFSNAKIFVKPHPLDTKSLYQRLKHPNVVIIEDKDFFPKVSFVISYMSTLAFDYENQGIRVVYHQDKCVNELESEIRDAVIYACGVQ